jgi:hypothetical protein
LGFRRVCFCESEDSTITIATLTPFALLDANAVTSSGVRSGLFIPNTMPGISTASLWLDRVQKAQMIPLIPEYVPRLYEATTTGNTK